MAQFILLLRGVNEGLTNYSPEELQKLFEKYDDWVEGIRNKDKLRGARRLQDAVRHRIDAQNGKVIDGPFAETKETIGGFFLVECQEVEEAMRLAKQCPVLLHGGSVEVRQIEDDCRYSEQEARITDNPDEFDAGKTF
ncbi:MAG: transcription initiation protein [Gammaproteobacteria bacterium]|nr:transcription initiation protein [Phycisphaerae bacterium]NIW10624.1 transcription initiation protein [Gammaproteobacteria bacterium]